MTLLRAMDDIDEPPDPTRPRNPWPRLLLFGLVMLIALGAIGACIAAFTSSVPTREVRVALNEIDAARPRFEPVIPFGSDSDGATFGVYVGFGEDGELVALLSREPSTGCQLQFDGTARAGGVTGVLVDPCGPARYSRAGTALHEGAPRDLARFAFEIDEAEAVVNIDRVELGACRAVTVGCSRPGSPEERSVPSGELRGQFGAR
jgi:hypothetical protein